MRPKGVLLVSLLLLLLPGSAVAECRPEVSFDGKRSLNMIVELIDDAHESILVAAYSFTSKPIAEALVRAHKRGVSVYVVADERSNQGKYTATTFVANHGASVRLNGAYSIMHNKFIVVDGQHVETGSFNYSAAAVDKNAENIVVFKNAREVAETYKRQWLRLWQEGKDLEANVIH